MYNDMFSYSNFSADYKFTLYNSHVLSRSILFHNMLEFTKAISSIDAVDASGSFS